MRISPVAVPGVRQHPEEKIFVTSMGRHNAEHTQKTQISWEGAIPGCVFIRLYLRIERPIQILAVF